jgi:hypothetical protein
MMSVVTSQTAEHPVWRGDCHLWHLLKSPGLSVIQERVSSGRHEVRHCHHHAHQFFSALSARATLEADRRTVVLARHHGLSVAARVPPRLSNRDSYDFVLVLVSTRPSHGDRVVVEEAP